MKLILTVDIDGTYEACEEVIDQLEDLITEHAQLQLGPTTWAEVTAFKEAKA